MRILYIHQYFRHPKQAGPYRSFYLAQALVEQGHEVTVITAHHLPQAIKQHFGKLKVHYLSVPYSNEYSSLMRYKAFFLFVWKGFFLMKKLKIFDAVYATSTPLTVGVLGLAAKFFWSKPFVFEIRDLWPEAPIQLGYLKNPLMRKLALWLEKLIYRHASGIVTLSPPNELYIKNRVKVPVAMIPNLAIPVVEKEALLSKSLVIGYFGTLGKANGLVKLITLARKADEMKIPGFEIKVAGDGALKQWFLEQLNKYNIQCVTYLGHLEPDAFKAALASIHFGYVSFRDEPILEHCSPNKYFDYLAAGVPTIVNFGGWLADLSQNSASGFIHIKEEEQKLLEDLTAIFNNEGQYNTLRINALNLSTTFSAKLAGHKLGAFLGMCFKPG